jgi:hypothetical protein
VSKTGLRVDWRRHEDDSGALLSGLTGQGFHRRPGGGATSRGGHARREASRETRRTTCHRRWSRRVYGEPILVSAAEDGVDGRAGVAGRQRTLQPSIGAELERAAGVERQIRPVFDVASPSRLTPVAFRWPHAVKI